MADILVIAGDSTHRATLHRALENAGHDVYEAESGAQGLRMLAAFGFDLVIVDVVTPEHDGIEVIPIIRSSQDAARILVITGGAAQAGQDLLAAAINVGADRGLRKPLRPSKLVRAVDELLRASMR